MTRTLRIDIRATPEEHERYQEAADRAGYSLSEWIRRTLDRAAEEQPKKRKARK